MVSSFCLAVDPTEVESDEVQGKSRWRFKPRGLSITWSDNKTYWSMPDKGTEDPAELLGVSWLEINGSSPEPLEKGKRYALSFKISLGTGYHGWCSSYPVLILAKIGTKGSAKWAKVDIAGLISEGKLTVDNITEIPEGKLHFDVPTNAADTKLKFGLYETWSEDCWKVGLKIHEAIVEEMPAGY